MDFTYHHAASEGDASSAVSFGHNVSVADAEERDRRQPHGVKEVGVLGVVEPVQTRDHPCFTASVRLTSILALNEEPL